MRMRATRRGCWCVAISALLLVPVGQEVPAGQTPAEMNAREAGARYGQALGVALVCYGLRTRSDGLSRLAAAHSDAKDHPDFQAEADKVLKSWQEASSCQNAGGPNPCRLVHEWSCRDALREIGPQGTELPGLVEEVTPGN
jgi:hypothetical protein